MKTESVHRTVLLASLLTEFLRKHGKFYKVNIGVVLNDAKDWWERGGRLLLWVRMEEKEPVFHSGGGIPPRRNNSHVGMELGKILACSTN